MLTEIEMRLMNTARAKGLNRWEKDRAWRKLFYFYNFRGAKLLSREPFGVLGKRAVHPMHAAIDAVKALASENDPSTAAAVYCYMVFGVRQPEWAGVLLRHVTSPAARRLISHWSGVDDSDKKDVFEAFEKHIGGGRVCGACAQAARAERSPLTRLETQWVAVLELAAHERRTEVMYAVGLIEHNWRASVWRRRVLYNPATAVGKVFFAARLAAERNTDLVL